MHTTETLTSRTRSLAETDAKEVVKAESNNQQSVAPIVIIGMGVVGIRAAQELLRREHDYPLVLYGDEPDEPYNRARLSQFLAGKASREGLGNEIKIPADRFVQMRQQCSVLRINRSSCTVVDAKGNEQTYSKLVLALGSHAWLPDIPGIYLGGVYAFHSMQDTLRLLCQRSHMTRTVILGGGPLAIEAAFSLASPSNHVSIIERGPYLLHNRLDVDASRILCNYINAKGIQIISSDRVTELVGHKQVAGVFLESGRSIKADTVVVAAGVSANVDLAVGSGLEVQRGIVVNDHLQTTDPNIYAIGDCAEFQGKTSGLVAPGFEQAVYAVDNMLGGNKRYQGSEPVMRLKVVDIDVISMGQLNKFDPEILNYHVWHKNDHYRKLVLHRDILVGVIAIGVFTEASQIQQAIQQQWQPNWWHLHRFRKTGLLWREALKPVSKWPQDMVVCHCTGVTRGMLSEAINSGFNTVDALVEGTGASSVCGTCRENMASLLGLPVSKSNGANIYLLAAAILTVAIAIVFMIASPIPFSDSMTLQWSVDKLWLDSYWKQVTGYTLLSLALINMIMPLRKYWSRFRWGGFSSWRTAHVLLGALSLVLLIVHTGLHSGNNFNQILLTIFIGLGLVGGLATLVQHNTKRMDGVGSWFKSAHAILFLPFPALLGFHIVSVYYF